MTSARLGAAIVMLVAVGSACSAQLDDRATPRVELTPAATSPSTTVSSRDAVSAVDGFIGTGLIIGDAFDLASLAGSQPFIGVAGLGGNAEMCEFETDTGALGHIEDVNGAVWAWYEVYSRPMFTCMTADGRLEVFNGAVGAANLREIIDEMLAT